MDTVSNATSQIGSAVGIAPAPRAGSLTYDERHTRRPGRRDHACRASPAPRPSPGCPASTRSTHADVAVVGVPFDSGVSYRPGRPVRPRPRPRSPPSCCGPTTRALDVSPVRTPSRSPTPATSRSTRSTSTRPSRPSSAPPTSCAAGGTRLITIGGDHTIALPLLRASPRTHGPVAVVHFDAHLDTWDTYFGAPYTHGTPFRRAGEEGLLDPERCLHVGIRGPLYAAKRPRGRRRARLPGRRAPTTTSSTGSRGVDRADAPPARRRARSTSPSTSTCSTPRTPPAPAPRRRAG